MSSRPLASVVVAIAAAAGAGGCGQGDAAGEVRTVTESFYSALETGDGEAACARLDVDTRAQIESQERRDCRDAVSELELQGGGTARVEVFVTSAKVELSSGESAFLDRGAQGWRLSAVGCRPEEGKPADRPYECEAEA